MKQGLRAAVCLAALAGVAAGCKDETTAQDTRDYGAYSLVGPDQPPKDWRDLANSSAGSAEQYNIAYTYNYTFQLPHSQIRPLYDRHRAFCEDAGPSRCQIAGSYVTDDLGANKARLELRAEPNWLAGFRARLAKDAAAAGGEITVIEIQSEDLSQNIIDAEAHLRSQTLLRDRLRTLVTNRNGKLSELLELERELARVQEELDKTQSRIAHLRARIAMADITFMYRISEQEMEQRAAREERYSPKLWETARSSLLYAAEMVMFVLPWLVPAALLIWGLLRWRDRKLQDDS